MLQYVDIKVEVVYCGQGMGEGEGAKDVSDQIENEDQLTGARQKDAPEEEQVLDLL